MKQYVVNTQAEKDELLRQLLAAEGLKFQASTRMKPVKAKKQKLSGNQLWDRWGWLVSVPFVVLIGLGALHADLTGDLNGSAGSCAQQTAVVC